MIVADSGPLNFLIQLGRSEVLPVLFDQVLLPFETRLEMTRKSTPFQVRQWVDNPPSWLLVSKPLPELMAKGSLHIGELVAIHHALQSVPGRLLVDDRRARTEAKRLGLTVYGTLRVLFKAGMLGLLDFEADLHLLLNTDFRVSDPVVQELLGQWRKR